MGPQTGSDHPSQQTLLEVIRTQTDIAKLGHDLGAVMQLVTERIEKLTGAGGAAVELAEGDDMVYRAASGVTSGQLGLRLSRAASLSGLCVAEKRVLRCDDSESDERVDREACRRVGLRSMVVAPLIHHDTSVGSLKVMSPRVAGFSDADVKTLEMMSGLIAAAMFHAAKLEDSELYFRATHDPLTGLANRALFFDHLHQCLAAAKRHGDKVGVLNLDMDRLKPINDAHGHAAGDAAIREIAARVSGACREADLVARLGGDEFGAIVPRIARREELSVLRQRIAERVGAPFGYQGRDLALGASMGEALFPEDGADVMALMDKADREMYSRKRARKGG